MSVYETSITNPKKQLEFYKDLSEQLEKDNQELKKQLEDMTLCRDIASGHRKEVQDRETILLNQQKEFIEWLESNLEALEMCDRELILTNNKKEIKAYKEVLSKYKEIVGFNGN